MNGGADPATSVVVSTYDEQRWDDLESCLRSLQEGTLSPLETIVVVDHNDELLARVEDAFPEVKAIANRRARGLAGARNTGIEEAAGEVVAFIDDDARAERSWLERLSTCFSKAGVVGAGGALLPRWEAREVRWFPAEFLWVVGCSYTGLPTRRAPVRNPIGANMAVRADVLAEVGGFREGVSEEAPREIRSRGVVRAGGNVPDDTDLAIRVSKDRPDCIWLYEPEARVLHTVTPERATLGYFVRRCIEEGDGKARLARYVGADAGLSSERRYVSVALPRGILRGLGDLFRGDPFGPLRSAAIVLGLALTTAGFLKGSIAARWPRR